jgi:hypothetical protein
MAEVAQEENATCIICIETFNKTIRKRITCQNCNTDMCTKCVKRYLAENLQQPNCMQCRWIYSKEFMDTSISKNFRKQSLQQLREIVLIEREKQRLPELMHRAQARKECLVLQKRMNDIYRLQYNAKKDASMFKKELATIALLANVEQDKFASTTEAYRSILANLDALTEEQIAIQSEYRTQYQVYASGAAIKVSQIVQCITPECKGYLDNDYKCGLCNIQVCKECHVELCEGHQCNPDNVESVKAIATETRPCPNCRTPIFKILGCDQMFCTLCHTAFDWSTGNIDTGRMHNPHYFEWLRARNLQMPREIGDVPCGDLPSFAMVEQKMIDLKGCIANTIYLREILKMAVQLREKEMPRFPVIHGRNNEMDLVSIDYLAEVIHEKAWKKKLVQQEIAREMNTEQRLLLDMLLAVLSDYLNGMDGFTNESQVETMLFELESLRVYYNSCIDNLNERFEVRKFRRIPYDWSKLYV